MSDNTLNGMLLLEEKALETRTHMISLTQGVDSKGQILHAEYMKKIVLYVGCRKLLTD